MKRTTARIVLVAFLASLLAGTIAQGSACADAACYLLSLRPPTGALRWAAPVADRAHYGIPVASANGVVFTADLKGFLDAYDAVTGIPLAHRPLSLDAPTPADTTFTFGGVSIAHGTVFVSVGIQNTGLDVASAMNGLVIALRS